MGKLISRRGETGIKKVQEMKYVHFHSVTIIPAEKAV